jgi:hypothetical protein
MELLVPRSGEWLAVPLFHRSRPGWLVSQLFTATRLLAITDYTQSQSQIQSYFTTGGLPPISSFRRQTCWGSRPDIFFFLQLNPYGHSPWVSSSLTRKWACLLWISLAFVKCTYRTYSMLLKILTFTILVYTTPLSVQALQCRSCLSYLAYATTAA